MCNFNRASQLCKAKWSVHGEYMVLCQTHGFCPRVVASCNSPLDCMCVGLYYMSKRCLFMSPCQYKQWWDFFKYSANFRFIHLFKTCWWGVTQTRTLVVDIFWFVAASRRVKSRSIRYEFKLRILRDMNTIFAWQTANLCNFSSMSVHYTPNISTFDSNHSSSPLEPAITGPGREEGRCSPSSVSVVCYINNLAIARSSAASTSIWARSSRFQSR